MGYRANLPFSASVFDPKEYVNSEGNAECVEFVRQVTKLPHTGLWIPGAQVKGNPHVPIGTAIAIFDETGSFASKYGGSAHAAIYISQGALGLVVVDQWKGQGKVKPHVIWFPEHRTPTKPTRNGDLYRVIELIQPKLL